MKLSPRQQALHWALWKRVKAKEMPGRETWTKHEENERRHALYVQALGEEKSLTEFDNDDFDKVKAAMLAIVEPGNLNAQLHALQGQRKRLMFGIRKLTKSMGADEFYVQGIIDRMDARRGEKSRDDDDEIDAWERERERGERPQRKLEELHPRELTKVMIALRLHEKRGMIHAGAPREGGCVHAHTPSPSAHVGSAHVRSDPDPF
jgi:hypothetical protein